MSWHVNNHDPAVRPEPGVWKINPNAPTRPETYSEKLVRLLAYLFNRYGPRKEDEDEE